jgi:hypothetical protein
MRVPATEIPVIGRSSILFAAVLGLLTASAPTQAADASQPRSIHVGPMTQPIERPAGPLPLETTAPVLGASPLALAILACGLIVVILRRAES